MIKMKKQDALNLIGMILSFVLLVGTIVLYDLVANRSGILDMPELFCLIFLVFSGAICSVFTLNYFTGEDR